MGRLKGQTSIEFVILVGFVMVAFTTFFIIINENLKEKTENKINMELKEVALTVKNEINLAHESMEGYSRNFSIPDKISGKDYTILANQGLIKLQTIDGKHHASYTIQNITGMINKTLNSIKKENGQVKLNQ